jgi:hypothetical protein
VKLRALLAGGAVIVAATAMTSAATSAHAATTATRTTSATPKLVNLSSAFKAALKADAGRPMPGKAGIARPLGYHVKTPASNAACTEPNCNLWYHGGLIQTKPRVYVVFWGPKWKTSTYASERGYLIKFYEGLGGASDHWSITMTQYKGRNGRPGFGTTVFKGSYLDGAAPPASVGQTQLGAEAAAIAGREHLSGSNLQIVIASQSGTCFSDGFAGSCGSPQSSGKYCAYHSDVNGLSYTNLPYQLDAGSLCGQGWHGSNLAGFSVVGGHEYAESVTDPFPNGGASYGWIDLPDQYGGEIGDKCAWGGSIWNGNDPAGFITLSTGKFMMQSLWSNAAHGCKM